MYHAPMVRAYHIIFTAYGFWLPNDPRGSWSDFVRSWELFRFGGPATKVTTTRSLARKPHDRAKRLAAKELLKYPSVVFNGRQALSIARGFKNAIAEGGYRVHACAILPEHVHMVLGRDGRKSEAAISHFKRAASKQLRADGLHPLAAWPNEDGTLPTPWVRKGWSVYLNDEEDILRAIRYAEMNPVREGKKPQKWSFVIPWVG